MQMNRTDRNWSFAVLHGRQGFTSLRPRWQALADRLPDCTYLQQPAWIGSYLDAQSDAVEHDALRFVTASRGDRLEGVLVLRCVGGLRSRLTPELEMVTGEHQVLADLVADRRETSLWPALHDWLARQRALRWAVMRLPAVCADSTLSAMIQDSAAPRCLRTARTCSAWLDCSHDVAHATQAVSKSFRQNLNRLTRRAQTLGTLSYQVASTPQALEQALDAFLGVEASGWKRERGTAIAQDPALVAFYRSLVRDFGARGACRIHLLMLDGQTIAAQFGLVSARQLNLLKIGYSQDHASIAPGHLIMRHTIEQVCADPALDRLSFVTHPDWSHLWKPRLTEVDSVSLYAPTLAGRMAHALAGWRQARRQRGVAEPVNPPPDTLDPPQGATTPVPGLVRA